MKTKQLSIAVALMIAFVASVAMADDAEKLYRMASQHQQAYLTTKKRSELDEALATYNRVVKEYPQSSMAGDALFQIAVLRHDPLRDDVKAKRALNALLERYPHGNKADAAKHMLAELNGDPSLATEVKESQAAAPPINRFAEPAAAKRDGKALLHDVKKELQERVVKVTLELDTPTAFTTTLTPYGLRTKSPLQLGVNLAHTRKENQLPSTLAIDSPLVHAMQIKHFFLSKNLEVRFDLGRDTKYEVKAEGANVVVQFFKESEQRDKASGGAKAKPKKAALRIIIDPGHGGKDTGAIGKKGTKEKDVVLQIAKRLAEELHFKLGAQVSLTRTGDRELTLAERDELAVKKGADLFLSIHANASRDHRIAGIQTYYLNNATDKASERLATRENKSAGKPLPEVQHILSTMMQNSNVDESRLLAQDVQRALVRGLAPRYSKINDLKVQSALFYVLVGAKCPSVLVETSFVSNPREEERLRNTEYQKRLVSSITAGVKHYLETHRARIGSL